MEDEDTKVGWIRELNPKKKITAAAGLVRFKLSSAPTSRQRRRRCGRGRWRCAVCAAGRHTGHPPGPCREGAPEVPAAGHRSPRTLDGSDQQTDRPTDRHTAGAPEVPAAGHRSPRILDGSDQQTDRQTYNRCSRGTGRWSQVTTYTGRLWSADRQTDRQTYSRCSRGTGGHRSPRILDGSDQQTDRQTDRHIICSNDGMYTYEERNSWRHILVATAVAFRRRQSRTLKPQ